MLCLAASLGLHPALAECQSNQGLLESTKKLDDGVSIRVTPMTHLEAMVTVSMVADNMSVSNAVPRTINIKRSVAEMGRPIEILSARQRDFSREFRWRHSLYFKIGNSGGQPDSTYVYSLPYSPGEKHYVVQGYFGKHSHNAETQDIYAIDFEMPEGTTICAAREGEVVAYKNDSNVGGSDRVYEDCANYVVLKHADGSYATYCHLRFNGVLVKLGQKVAKGAPLGLSGSTGWATAPHLHFSVFVPVDGLHKATYPVKFATDQGILRLEEGATY